MNDTSRSALSRSPDPRAKSHPVQFAIKRLIDIVASGILLVLLSPILLLIVAAIKLTSRGPLFYKPRWVVLNERVIEGYKFRTMVVNAREMEAVLQARNEMKGPAFKITNDPRVTPVGRFLRKYSLDELPQLWCVFIGDLSLVGPRAPQLHEFERMTPFQRQKLTVTQGITCLWQIGGRHRINDYDDWVRKDLEYIQNWSIWLDIRILLLTVPVVLRGSGV